MVSASFSLLVMIGVNMQPYQSGYTAPARPPSDENSIDIGYVRNGFHIENQLDGQKWFSDSLRYLTVNSLRQCLTSV